MLGNDARLVALQMAYEVPDQVVTAGRRHLFDALPGEVFAKIPLPAGSRLQHLVRALCLACGKQANGLARPASLYCSFCQQILDFSKVFRDSNHVLLRMLRYTRLRRSSPSYGKSEATF